MGGGSSASAKPFAPWEDPSIEVKHREKFYCFLRLDCKDFKPALRETKVIVELDGATFPYTCENFRRLCCGEGPEGAAGYKGNTFFHDSKDGVHLIGGRFGQELKKTAGGYEYLPGKGKGVGRGVSAFDGRPFEQENEELDHEAGTLSMVASDGACASEFLVCLDGGHQAAAMDGEHVAFGKVVEGIEVVQEVGRLMMSNEWLDLIVDEGLANKGFDFSGRPARQVSLTDCGEIAWVRSPSLDKNSREYRRQHWKPKKNKQGGNDGMTEVRKNLRLKHHDGGVEVEEAGRGLRDAHRSVAESANF